MRSMKQRRNNAYHIFVAQTPLVQQPVGDPLEMGLDHRMSMGIALEYIVSRQHRYTVHGITMPSPLALQTQFLPIQTSSKNRVIRGQCGASESLSWWRSQYIPHEKIRCHYPIEKSHPPNIKQSNTPCKSQIDLNDLLNHGFWELLHMREGPRSFF